MEEQDYVTDRKGNLGRIIQILGGRTALVQFGNEQRWMNVRDLTLQASHAQLSQRRNYMQWLADAMTATWHATGASSMPSWIETIGGWQELFDAGNTPEQAAKAQVAKRRATRWRRKR